MRTKEQELQGIREHRLEYEALAQKLGPSHLMRMVPFKALDIERAISAGDEHLNTLPLAYWDAMDYSVRFLARLHGFKYWSLCETVCVLKHVARAHLVVRGLGQ